MKDESHQIPEYLILTPVNLSQSQKYDYDRSDLWIHIGYLPQSLKDKKFYSVQQPSPFEKIILENVEKLRQVEKFYDMKALKKKHP
jgi:replication-associated recombination protein RarA